MEKALAKTIEVLDRFVCRHNEINSYIGITIYYDNKITDYGSSTFVDFEASDELIIINLKHREIALKDIISVETQEDEEGLITVSITCTDKIVNVILSQYK